MDDNIVITLECPYDAKPCCDKDFKDIVHDMIRTARNIICNMLEKGYRNNTKMPITFIMPAAEAAKLATSTSPFSNGITRLNILQDMFNIAFDSPVIISNNSYLQSID